MTSVRRGGPRAPVSSGPPVLRPATAGDLPACTRLWRTALLDYLGRLNQPQFVGDLAPLERLLSHLLRTDPELFWVATRPEGRSAERGGRGGRTETGELVGDGERLVGFGSANVRGRAWFLAMLFVDPGEQGRGIGSALLERTMPAGARPGRIEPDGWTFGTATDSAQPISNGLYARLGLVPRVPVLHLLGHVGRADALPGLPDGVTVAELGAQGDGELGALERVVDALDRELLGYEHPEDHGWLASERRRCFVYRGRDGEPLAYGYTSRVGRVGPVAVRDAGLFRGVLGHLLATVPPAGASSVWVPGSAGDAVVGLLDAGLRIEGFPALLCWDVPAADVSRYLPIALALL